MSKIMTKSLIAMILGGLLAVMSTSALADEVGSGTATSTATTTTTTSTSTTVWDWLLTQIGG